MEKKDLMFYQKLNYSRYQEKLKKLEIDPKLQKLGLKKIKVGTSVYGYDLDLITVGFGEKELFLVGGTHGSEVIGVDFLLHFLEQLPNLDNFDPNLIKIVVMPLQNPEGFDISSNTYKNIDDEIFKEKSYEYYLRYRTDSIIVNANNSFNKFIHDMKKDRDMITASQFLKCFKNFIHNNDAWKRLEGNLVIPEMVIFNQLVSSLENVDSYQDLQFKLIQICNKTLEKISNEKLSSNFAYFFINELKNVFSRSSLWEDIEKATFPKLYQKMFDKSSFDGVLSKKMALDVEEMYKVYNHPKGSQIGHDSTGVGINLNANHILSPGILNKNEDKIVLGPGVKSNIKNYLPGPLGVPSLDRENFSFAVENIILHDLLSSSYQTGNFLGCLLYHGTGGLIYYEPYQDLMDENTYQDFYQYNEELANIYHDNTDYKLLHISDTTGYGDLLRRTFPGVLMIELSKMGGNPIGPYGDPNNIYRVFEDNTRALNSILGYFNKIKDNISIKTK